MMIKKKGRFDVGATLDHLETVLKEKGIKPIARVNHAEAAKSVGMIRFHAIQSERRV